MEKKRLVQASSVSIVLYLHHLFSLLAETTYPKRHRCSNEPRKAVATPRCSLPSSLIPGQKAGVGGGSAKSGEPLANGT